MTAGRHVVLVGMMGSGKSTVGRLVAERLGWPFVDSDEQVEARTGRTVREIFEDEGEATYRRYESDALAAALSREEPTVVAAAGGTVLDAGNRRLMREAGTVVWLAADPAVLATRVGSGDHRPLLASAPEEVLRRLHAERRALYESVAHHVVDVGGPRPDEVAESVLGLVP